MKKGKFNKSGHTEVITNTEQSLSEVVLIRMVLCLVIFFFFVSAHFKLETQGRWCYMTREK